MKSGKNILRFFSFLLIIPLSAVAGVDLVLNNTDAPYDPIPAGGTVTYTLTIQNNGDVGATGVVTTHSVPANVSYEGMTGAGVTCTGLTVGQAGPGTLTCTHPDLPPSATSDFTIDLKTTVQDFYTFGAVVSSTEPDDNTANNTNDESTTVKSGANVAVSLTPVNATAAAGSGFTWALDISNAGPDPAESLRVTVPVPAGFTVSSLPAGCSNIVGTITCDIAGPIANGGSVSIGNISGVISAGSGSTVTASASVGLSPGAPSSAPEDPDSSDNTAVANVTVTAGTDMAISKSRSVTGSILVGDSFNFTISPSYSGDSPTSITVTDTLPANYTVGTVASPQNGWTCTVAGQLVTCTKPNGGASGFNQSLGDIVIPVTVNSAGTNISNTASISAAGPVDSNPANNTATDGGVTLEDPVVRLGITKSGPEPNLVVVGVPFQFSIQTSNTGTTAFIGDMEITDTVPANMTINSYAALNGWTCSPATPVAAGNTITCTRTYNAPGLAPSAAAPPVVFDAQVSAAGPFTNSATITPTSCTGLVIPATCSGSTASYSGSSSTGSNSADIRLVKGVSAAATPSPAGDVVTYTLEIVNDGPNTSDNVVLTDTFDTLINNGVGATGEGYISEVIAPGLATGSSCSSVASGSAGRALTCNFASIPVCTAGTDCPVVTVQVRPGGDGGTRINSANVISNGTADPDHTNDTATASIEILARADIAVTKTVNPATVPAGQNLTYIITAPNHGPSRADNVTITDTLPEGVTFVSATPSAGTCATTPGTNVVTTAGNKTLSCNLGNINNSSQQTVTVVVRPTTTTRGTTITNNVSVATDTTEPSGAPANNTDTIDAVVTNPSLDLVLNKDDSIDPVAVGDDTVYTVRVTNSGPSTAEDVIITDNLPASGLSFQSVVASQGACGTVPAVNSVGGTIVCQIGTIAAGDSETITVTMRGTVKGVVTNHASVTSTESLLGFDVLPGNNDVSENTTVRTKADMEVVSKIPSVTTVNLRDDFNFIIRVRNNSGTGLAEADDVVVSDSLPAGMELTGSPTATVVSGSATNTTCTGTSGNTSFSCNLGTVSSGGVVEITLPVQLVSVSSDPQTFTNTATVTTSSLDINPANNSNSGNVAVNSSSISGRVFRDFNSDGAINGTDAGISGITMTLTGTTFDGVAINTSVITLADGSYTFTGVPAGNYTITEGTVPSSEHLVDGAETDGSLGGGNLAVNDKISNIVLPAGTDATDYLFAEIPVPLVGVAKKAGTVTDNGDGSFTVPFTFTVINAGGTPLDTIQITDDLTAAFGNYTNASVPGVGEYTVVAGPSVSASANNAVLTVNPGFNGDSDKNLLIPATSSLPDFIVSPSSGQIVISVRFFPPAGNLGPFNNSATATGRWPDTGTVVTDDSVDGLEPDPTHNDDPTDDTSPTIVNVFGQAIGVAKQVSGPVIQTGPKRFKVPYSIIVKNVATAATATNVQVTDDLTATFPTAQSITISAPVAINGCTGTVLNVASPAFTGTGQNNLLAGNQNLLVGESCTITFTAEVDFGSNALPAGDQNNQATATTAIAPGGVLIATDLSDDGIEPDANGNHNASDAGENDPTPVSFIPPGGLSSVSGKVWLDVNHDRIDNDGSGSPIAGVIVEVLNAAGDIVGTATTATDGTYTVTDLFPSTPGEASTEYSIRFRDPVSMSIYGFPVSQDPVPARNGSTNTGIITGLQLAPGVNTLNQSLPLDPSGVIYDAVTRLPLSGATVTLLSSGVAVPDMCLIGTNTQVTGVNGFYQYLLVNPAPAGCPGNAVYTLQVVQPAGYLPPASTLIPPTAGPYTPTNGGVDPIQAQAGPPTGADPTTYYFDFNLNIGTSSAVVNNHIPLDPILAGAIVITKTTPRKDVVRGELVPYTITASNTLSASLVNIALQDQIPAGFKYVSGSATINGIKTEPLVNGRNLTWPNQTFAPTGDAAKGDIKTIQLMLIIGSGVSEGQYVNQAWAINTVANSRVSNIGMATVRVVPDPLFDCSDLIGKVFDDKNINGYQDEGEPGLAGVRVVTPRGLLMTTDNEGRFHIACADVPNELHGSNFILKLDERTLPSGYRVTTENPRVVRLTRGKLIKLNFGAALHRVVRVDLSSQAFSNDGKQLRGVISERLSDLLEILKQQPSQLRLSYHLKHDEDKADAKARMDVFAERLETLWQACDCSNYALNVEQEFIMHDGDTTVWSEKGRVSR